MFAIIEIKPLTEVELDGAFFAIYVPLATDTGDLITVEMEGCNEQRIPAVITLQKLNNVPDCYWYQVQQATEFLLDNQKY